MFRESSGKAGEVNKTTGASGLLQVMPGTLDWYNKKTGDNVSLSTMRSKTNSAGAHQIKVGLWVLATFWHSAYRWLTKKNQTENIPLDDMVRFASAFYVAGPGTTQDMGERLSIPITWAVWETRYPKSNINPYANGVWTGTQEQKPTWDLSKISSWLKGTIDGDNGGDSDDDDDDDTAIGLLLGLAIILGAWIWMDRS
jgi:hypothetical protein